MGVGLLKEVVARGEQQRSSSALLTFPAGLRRSDVPVGVAAEAETETDTETGTETEIETETGRRTGRGLAGLVHAPETGSGAENESESEAKRETSLPAGASALRAPGKTLIGGRTNTWSAPHQRSPQWGTSTVGRSPASCSLDALSSWRGYGS